MEFKPFENPWIKKIRFLTTILICSVSLNIGLMTSIIYSTIVQKNTVKNVETAVSYQLTSTNAKVLNRFFNFTFDQLLAELDNKVFAEDGYMYRDLALACLVSYHYFDIERAVTKSNLQHRSLTFIHQDGGETFELTAFPGLDHTDFQRVHAFVKSQKWPLTSEGIFHELKKEKGENFVSLTKAFCTTSEFYTLFALFNRGEEKISQERLLPMLLAGPWHLIDSFCKAQKNFPDISKNVMRKLLKKYIKLESHHAASIWIAIDSEYVLRQLSDEELAHLINGINENTQSIQLFLKKTLCSVRSDHIRKITGIKLYAITGKSIPEPYKHEIAMKTFLPAFFFKVKEKKAKETALVKSMKIYRVKNGDSLWKIAHKYSVSIEELRKNNHLKTDVLKPGQELVINGPVEKVHSGKKQHFFP